MKKSDITKFINYFKKEDNLILERHGETILISESHAIYEVPSCIYDQDFRIKTPRFPELENHVCYMANRKNEIPSPTGSNKLKDIYEKARHLATKSVELTKWVIKDGADLMRIYKADEFVVACDEKFVELASYLDVDIHTALGSENKTPVVFNTCMVLPMLIKDSEVWNQLEEIMKVKAEH